jgi:hypothetical protein
MSKKQKTKTALIYAHTEKEKGQSLFEFENKMNEAQEAEEKRTQFVRLLVAMVLVYTTIGGVLLTLALTR